MTWRLSELWYREEPPNFRSFQKVWIIIKATLSPTVIKETKKTPVGCLCCSCFTVWFWFLWLKSDLLGGLKTFSFTWIFAEHKLLDPAVNTGRRGQTEAILLQGEAKQCVLSLKEPPSAAEDVRTDKTGKRKNKSWSGNCCSLFARGVNRRRTARSRHEDIIKFIPDSLSARWTRADVLCIPGTAARWKTLLKL